MRVEKSGSVAGQFKGLVVGLIVGILIGSAGLVFSAMTKEGWGKQPAAFKLGYIAGFTDVVRMVKSSTPGHEVSKAFTIPRTAKPINWLFYIEKVFEEDERKGQNLTQAIAFAGAAMEQEYGGDLAAADGLEQLAQVLSRRREAFARGDIKPTPPDVLARQLAINARERSRTKCMGKCRRGCRETCKAEIKANFPPLPELLPREAEPTEPAE